METYKRTPLELFNLPQHFLIPLFQRRYVWKEEDQWEPLWKDVRRIVDMRVADPLADARHFLGAVVIQGQEARTKNLTTWQVIDGQQRLTTVQLLMSAASGVFKECGMERLSTQLEWLIFNDASFVTDEDDRLKLRHLNNDRSAFDEVMEAETPVDHSALKHSGSRIVHAHRYFTGAVTHWLGDEDDSEFAVRAERLAEVLRGGLQMVTIELLASENSQEIFETLNARGTPLTAADLVRNFVFQRLEAEGADTRAAYKEDWPFEDDFWAKDVSVGRYMISRSSLFLNQWLVSRVGEEISPQSTFTRFKAYVENDDGHKMLDLLRIIKQQAGLYRSWTEAASKPDGQLNTTEMAMYRMQASKSELLKPLLIWLTEPEQQVGEQIANDVIHTAESWVTRRQLLRLPTSDLGRVVADIIRTHRGSDSAELGSRVSRHLTRQDVTSTYWPGDDEIRAALTTEPFYHRHRRAQLRSYLEAIENKLRDETGQPQIERSSLPIEHILPQKWADHWPVVVDDETEDGPARRQTILEGQEDRQQHVHRLGNLTLLTKSLNSKVSNGPWQAKRKALLAHNTVKLTGRLVERTEDHEWDESLIDARTTDLVEQILTIWSVPDGHEGKVVDPQAKVKDWVEIKHLLDGGFLHDGDELVSMNHKHSDASARIVAHGHLAIDGKSFGTPSAAASHVRKGPTNGWNFWGLPDGRRLRDIRTAFLNASSSDQRGDVAS